MVTMSGHQIIGKILVSENLLLVAGSCLRRTSDPFSGFRPRSRGRRSIRCCRTCRRRCSSRRQCRWRQEGLPEGETKSRANMGYITWK